MRIFAVLMSLLVGAMVAGCGGGSENVGMPAADGRGAIQMTVHWPAVSRLIPFEAQSIIVTVRSTVTPFTLRATKTITKPIGALTKSLVTIPNLPAEVDNVTATAYPQPDATGNAQATGHFNVTVQAGKTITTPPLVMATTVHQVLVDAVGTTSVAVGGKVVATASARDGGGSVVVVLQTNLKGTASDPAAFDIVQAGSQFTLTAKKAGDYTFSVVEQESGATTFNPLAIHVNPPPPVANIAVVDAENNRLVGLDAIPATVFSTISGLDGQVKFGFDDKASIYSINGNSSIVKLEDFNGTNRESYRFPGSGASVIGVDHSGQIYFYNDSMALNRIHDIGGGNLKTYNPTNQFGGHLLNGTNAIAFDTQNRIYLIQQFGGVTRIDDIAVLNPTMMSFGTTGSGVGQFKFPSDLAIDAQNRIYVADAGNHRIVRFDDLTGKKWVAFPIPSEVGSTTTAHDAIAVDRSTTTPHIYFSDANNSILYKMDDMNGTHLVQYGTKGSGNGQFKFPVSIAVK